MNYFNLAMRVFKKHNIDFVKVAVKKEKLKQLLYRKRRGEPIDPVEIAVLRKQIKESVKNINKVIGGFLK